MINQKTINTLSILLSLGTLAILYMNMKKQQKLWDIQSELHKEQLKKLKNGN